MKPEDERLERSSDPAPDGTAAHPAEAGSLWEQFLSRGNVAEALRRVEQNAGAPGPAAVDRLICQAIAQVLTPVFDPVPSARQPSVDSQRDR